MQTGGDWDVSDERILAREELREDEAGMAGVGVQLRAVS